MQAREDAILEVLGSVDGEQTVQLALREGCKVFTMQPVFQTYVNLKWYGRLAVMISGDELATSASLLLASADIPEWIFLVHAVL